MACAWRTPSTAPSVRTRCTRTTAPTPGGFGCAWWREVAVVEVVAGVAGVAEQVEE